MDKFIFQDNNNNNNIGDIKNNINNKNDIIQNIQNISDINRNNEGINNNGLLNPESKKKDYVDVDILFNFIFYN